MIEQYIQVKSSEGSGSGSSTIVDGVTITFVDFDGLILKIETVQSGSSATPPTEYEIAQAVAAKNDEDIGTEAEWIAAGSIIHDEYLQFHAWVGSYTNVTNDGIVGATYWMGSNLNSHLFITLDSITGLTINLYVYVSSGTVTVYWGDGTNSVSSGTALQTLTKTYSTVGSYRIEIAGLNSDLNFLGGVTYSYPVIDKKCITKAYIGYPGQLGAYSFYGQSYLESVMLSYAGSSEGTGIVGGFQYCLALKCLIIPETYKYNTSTGTGFGYSGLKHAVMECTLVTGGTSLFAYCYNLEYVNITARATQMLSNCYSLRKAILPATLTQINSQMFNLCKGLIEIYIPSSVTTIGTSAFNGCMSLEKVDMPSSVITIGATVFEGCSSLKDIILRSATVVSTGSNSNPLYTPSSGCNPLLKIWVPDALVDTYKADTYFSIYAERIYALSSYEE